MRRQRFILGAILLIAAAAVFTAFRHPSLHDGPPCYEGIFGHIEEFIADFNLNEKQKERIQTIEEGMKNEFVKEMDERKALMNAILTKLNSENPDVNGILNMMRENLKNKPNPELKKLDHMSELYNILNDVQKTKLVEKVRERLNKVRERMKCIEHCREGSDFEAKEPPEIQD